MKQIVDLDFNSFDRRQDMNERIRKEFYAAKAIVLSMGYEEYGEERSLPGRRLYIAAFGGLRHDR